MHGNGKDEELAGGAIAGAAVKREDFFWPSMFSLHRLLLVVDKVLQAKP
jgi:hypothetical protein